MLLVTNPIDLYSYCDVFQKCREVDPSGPLATLRKLLLSEESIATFKKWVQHHWYTVALAAIGVFLLLVCEISPFYLIFGSPKESFIYLLCFNTFLFDKLMRVVTSMLRDQYEAKTQALGDGEASNVPETEPRRAQFIGH